MICYNVKTINYFLNKIDYFLYHCLTVLIYYVLALDDIMMKRKIKHRFNSKLFDLLLMIVVVQGMLNMRIIPHS